MFLNKTFCKSIRVSLTSFPMDMFAKPLERELFGCTSSAFRSIRLGSCPAVLLEENFEINGKRLTERMIFVVTTHSEY